MRAGEPEGLVADSAPLFSRHPLLLSPVASAPPPGPWQPGVSPSFQREAATARRPHPPGARPSAEKPDLQLL